MKLCAVYTYMCMYDTITFPDPKEAKKHPQNRNATTALQITLGHL